MEVGVAIIIVLAVVLVLWFIIWQCCIIVVHQHTAVIIERMGRFDRVLEPGANIFIPLLDNVRILPWQKVAVSSGELHDTSSNSEVIDQRESIFHFSKMQVHTKDTLLVEVDAVVYYSLYNVKAALYEVDDLQAALFAGAQTYIKECFGSMTFQQALSSQNEINNQDFRVFKRWGVMVYRMEILSIQPCDVASKNMLKLQMIAERARRTAVVESDANKESLRIKSDGQKRIAELYGMNQENVTLKESEANAVSTVLLAEAEQKALQAVDEATLEDNVTLAEFYQSRSYLATLENVITSSSDTNIVLPFSMEQFKGIKPELEL